MKKGDTVVVDYGYPNGGRIGDVIRFGVRSILVAFGAHDHEGYCQETYHPNAVH